jgi:hypothetical protein
MSTISRPKPDEYPTAYKDYIDKVPDGDLLAILEGQMKEKLARLGTLDPERARFRYAEGKWSVTEVVGHINDGERIFAYRALRFARGDETPLPGFEENDYVPAGRFDRRTLAEVLDEAAAVRAASLALFRGLPVESFDRRGLANEKEISVRALAWVIAGHERHHLGVLRERYGID